MHVRVVGEPEGLELQLRLLAHRARHLELRGVVRGQELRDGAVHERGPLIGPLLLGHALEAHGLRVVQRVLAEDVHHHPGHEIELLVIVVGFAGVDAHGGAAGGRRDAPGENARRARGDDGARGGRGSDDRHGDPRRRSEVAQDRAPVETMISTSNQRSQKLLTARLWSWRGVISIRMPHFKNEDF